MCSNDDQGKVYKIINYKFHDPQCRGSCARTLPYKSYSENALFLLKSSILRDIDQTNCVYFDDDQGRVCKIVNFMTYGAGVLVLGCGHISHIVKMHYFFFKSSFLLPGFFFSFILLRGC